jgi:signal transduction histidine kinase
MMVAWEFNSTIYLYILASLVTLVAAWINWQERNQPGLIKLAIIMFLISLWASFSALEVSAQDVGLKMFFILWEGLFTLLFNTLLINFICEYFEINDLPRHFFPVLWMITFGFFIMGVSNPLHHLAYGEVNAGPFMKDIFVPPHGPLFSLWTVYQLILLGISLFLILLVIRSTVGWQRNNAVLLAVGIMLPYSSYVVYRLLPENALGINLMPIGFSFLGLIISGIVFTDLRRVVVQQTEQLRTTIRGLEGEIYTRGLLEKHLFEVQDTLARQMADQTQKLAGLYEMILLSGKSLPLQSVLEQSLERIRITLDCSAVCYYESTNEMNLLACSVSNGIEVMEGSQLATLKFEWLPNNSNVIARVDGRVPDDFPAEIRQAGFLTCTTKLVRVQEQDFGIFACFWELPHKFKVEEISLIGALSDELGVILQNAQMRELTSYDATQHERRRLARDLHDSVVQSLHSLVFTADIARKTAETKPDSLKSTLDHLSASAQLALREMRLLLYELRLVSADEIHFVEAIQTRLDAVERRANVQAKLVISETVVWPHEWDRELYSITMEALNNSLKHSRSTQVEVTVEGDDQHLELNISDNGKGFSPADVRRGGLGLSTMTERAERLGGQLKILSSPGSGTIINMSVNMS